MTEPVFLSLDDVLDIHLDQVQRYGGDPGIRDLGLLESAIAQPRATFGGEFLCADVFEMAAAYLYHIVENHPFIDGNKRTGAVAAFVFLWMNDLVLSAGEDEFEDAVMRVSKGEATKQEIASSLRQFSDKRV